MNLQPRNKFDDAGDTMLNVLLSAPPLFIEALCAIILVIGYFFWPVSQICNY